MLTKNDLSQIRDVVNEEVNVIIVKKLDSKLEPIKKDLTDLKSDVTDLKSDVTDLKSDVTDLKSDVTDLKSDVKYLKKKVNRIDKTVNLIVTNYDEADVKLHRRVRKIEDHIGLTY